MESELMTSGTGVERVVAVKKPGSDTVHFCDLPREIRVRLVGSKMRVVRCVCKSLRALVNENRATLVLNAMVDNEELDTMNVQFLFSILRSPHYEITDVVVAHALHKISIDSLQACGGQDWANFFQHKTISDVRDGYSGEFQNLFERFALAYDLHNPNKTRIDTVYDLLMRFDYNSDVVVKCINIFDVAFALAYFVNSPRVDLRRYIVMFDKIVCGPHQHNAITCVNISRFLSFFSCMSQRRIHSYPLGHFAGVAEMLPRVLLTLFNNHGTVSRICETVLVACMQLAYTNHFLVDMTRLELVDKAFRVVLMHPNHSNIVVIALKFFSAMINYVAHRELEEDVMHDVIRRCQQQVRNVPGLEIFLRSARVNPEFARVSGDITMTLLMCFDFDDV
jgi:hypothetical protein